MKRVIVASENQVKQGATRIGFESVFNDLCVVHGIKVESGVGDQPMSDSETLNGAMTRAMAAKEQIPEAEFWVGIEGGVEAIGTEMLSFAWVVIVGNKGMVGKAKTGTFYLPARVVELINSGKELGEADDIVFGKKDSKKTTGAVGLLTRNVIDREKYYAHAVALALIPFVNEELY